MVLNTGSYTKQGCYDIRLHLKVTLLHIVVVFMTSSLDDIIF